MRKEMNRKRSRKPKRWLAYTFFALGILYFWFAIVVKPFGGDPTVRTFLVNASLFFVGWENYKGSKWGVYCAVIMGIGLIMVFASNLIAPLLSLFKGELK